MKDDEFGGGHPGNNRGSESGFTSREVTSPRPGGLFGRMTSPRQGPADPAEARLRLVADRPVTKGDTGRRTSRPRLSADMWEDLRRVAPGPLAETALDLDMAGDSPVSVAFDKLRTLLLRELRANGWNRIAVTAPTRGCGTSFSAANLALSFSRIPGNRTVLLDLNMRRPALGAMFDIGGIGEMHRFLSGAIHLRDQVVCTSETLAIGFSQTPCPKAAQLLHSDCGAVVVNDLIDQLNPEVLVCDMPPLLENDDLAGFLPQVDGVLLVADSIQTLPEHITECERRLSGQTRVLGVVLNQSRRSGPAPEYV
jgi:Mrp family chromosome partitioning ATPase